MTRRERATERPSQTPGWSCSETGVPDAQHPTNHAVLLERRLHATGRGIDAPARQAVRHAGAGRIDHVDARRVVVDQGDQSVEDAVQDARGVACVSREAERLDHDAGRRNGIQADLGRRWARSIGGRAGCRHFPYCSCPPRDRRRPGARVRGAEPPLPICDPIPEKSRVSRPWRGVPLDVRQRRFDDLLRVTGLLGRPVPQRRAEIVRPCRCSGAAGCKVPPMGVLTRIFWPPTCVPRSSPNLWSTPYSSEAGSSASSARPDLRGPNTRRSPAASIRRGMLSIRQWKAVAIAPSGIE